MSNMKYPIFPGGGDRVCQHNLIYWHHHPYWGFGPSAHSFDGERRYANQRSLMVYLKKLGKDELPVDFEETLSKEERMFEYIFLNLRLRNGIAAAEFEARFKISLEQQFGKDHSGTSNPVSLIEYEGGNLRLSESGWLLADSIAAQFLGCIFF